MSALLQLRGQLVEAHRLAAEALREPDRAVVVAVGDEDRADARLDERLGGQLAGLAGADDHDAAPAQVAERLACELHRDRADRQPCPAPIVVSVRMRLPAASASRKSRFMIALVVPLDERQLVGALDLALDLGLAERPSRRAPR